MKLILWLLLAVSSSAWSQTGLRNPAFVAQLSGVIDTNVAGGGNEWTNNLLAYWRLDNNGKDDWGANHLVTNGSIVFTTGQITNAWTNTGASVYFSLADNTNISVADIDFTVAGWFNKDSSDTSSAKYAVAKADGAGVCEYGIYYYYETAGSNSFAFKWGGSTAVILRDAYVLADAGWHMVTAWHDATANKLYLRVDLSTVNEMDDTGATGEDGTGSLAIGRLGDLDAANWTGSVDKIAIWKRVLTSLEVTNLYNGGAGRDILDNP